MISMSTVLPLYDIMNTTSEAALTQICLVTEKMDCSLHEVIVSDEELSESRIKSYMYQILLAVKHLKDSHILHRDLKPGNVLIKDETLVKVIIIAVVPSLRDCQPYMHLYLSDL